jgi:nucleotide-binding universal stress UspA family protein
MSTSRTHHGVLVGVDGSAPSRVAVDWAAREAAMRNLPLTIIHVIPSATLPMWQEMPTPTELATQLEKDGREVLRDARRTAEESNRGSHPIRVDTELVTAGVVPALVDLSKDAEMIVVGCRGLGGISRRLVGSVSWGLVHHANCPVAVIHDEDPLMPIPAMAPVVVGIDGSPASESATAIAFDEASRRGVELVAVHAWSDFAVSELPGIEWSDVEKQAEEALAERLAGWQERYPDVTVRRVVVLERPAHQLLKQSESAQLTVVGSHGRGGFAGMLLGSVSSAVAESARMPVIVARPS